MKKLTITLTAVTALFLFSVGSQARLQGSRIKKITIPGQPVSLFGLHVNRLPVSFEQGFPAAPDWVDEVTVMVKNISSKTITELHIALNVPVFDDVEHVANFGFRHLQPLAPGRTVKVSTDLKVNTNIKAHIYGSGKSFDFSEARMVVDKVVFDDNTMWVKGTTFRINPNAPQEIEKLSGPRDSARRASSAPTLIAARFAADDTTPRCGKEIMVNEITC